MTALMEGLSGHLEREKSKRYRSRAQARSTPQLELVAEMEGWSPQLRAMIGQMSHAMVGPDAIKQMAKFYSQPGAADLMGDINVMRGDIADQPDFYGQEFASQMRNKMVGGARGQVAQAREAMARQMARSGHRGAINQSAYGMAAGGASRALAEAMGQFGMGLQQARAGQYNQQFTNQMALRGLQANLVTGSPQAPHVYNPAIENPMATGGFLPSFNEGVARQMAQAAAALKGGMGGGG